MKKLEKIVLFVLSIFLVSCYDNDEFGEWDADTDDRISDTEFTTAYDEFGYYSGWDVNRDGIVDNEEWDTGVQNYYDSYDFGTYGYYRDWDLDQDDGLNEEEFVSGSFDVWDTDGDGYLDREEYDDWYYERGW